MQLSDVNLLLENWGTKNDLVKDELCSNGCKSCPLNQKIILNKNTFTICDTFISIREQININD